MQIKRLLTLARFLETRVKDEVFNINFWTCGTTACAGGWACRIPAFRAAGLRVDTTNGLPAFNDQWGVDALAAFFDVTLVTGYRLFVRTHYRTCYCTTRLQVAKRIRQLVARERKRRLMTAHTHTHKPERSQRNHVLPL